LASDNSVLRNTVDKTRVAAPIMMSRLGVLLCVDAFIRLKWELRNEIGRVLFSRMLFQPIINLVDLEGCFSD
jgi:hypothetical protein